MIFFIIKDWIIINKTFLINRKYLLILFYNLIMVIGFPISILQSFFEWLDTKKENI